MFPIVNQLFRTSLRNRNIYAFGQSILKLRREKEATLAQKIKKGLEASFVSVTDTTIGTSSCGEMYNIVVESPLFETKSKLQQQRMVNEILSEQIKKIHGYSLKTRTPKKTEQANDKKTQQNVGQTKIQTGKTQNK